MSANAFPSPRQAAQSEAEYADQQSLQISQLFVAMTRARDALFLVSDGEPSHIVASCIERFELVEA